MRDIVNGQDGLDLLAAVGFAQHPARPGLSVDYSWHDSPEGGPVTSTVTVTGPDNAPVTAETAVYFAVITSTTPDILAIKFDSPDARDIMALALAAKNELRGSAGEHSKIISEDTFLSGDEVAIFNAFLGPAYWDWATDRPSGPDSIHLSHPTGNYGNGYTAWRDRRALQICPSIDPSAYVITRDRILSIISSEEGDAAFAWLQHRMGVTDGGVADLWFDGDNAAEMGHIVADAFLAPESAPSDVGPVADPLPEPHDGRVVAPADISHADIAEAMDAFAGRLEKRFGTVLVHGDRSLMINRLSSMMKGYVDTEANFASHYAASHGA